MTFPETLAALGLSLEEPDNQSIEVLSTFYGKCFESEFSTEYWADSVRRIVEYGRNGSAAKDILIDLPADSKGIVATKANEVLATVAYARRLGVVYVWGMYVCPDFKRQGIGRAMMHHVMSLAESEEVLQVFVLRENTGASHFYRALGLVNSGEMEGEVCPGVPALMDILGNRISTIYPVVA